MASRADNIASNLNLGNFAKATELKQRIWFTIGALIVFRFLSFVPLPGVNPLILSELYSQTRGGILDLFNAFSGGSLERMSLSRLASCLTSPPRSWCRWPRRCTRRWPR